eukprot:767094-Hanusia_phi.AAC.4
MGPEIAPIAKTLRICMRPRHEGKEQEEEGEEARRRGEAIQGRYDGFMMDMMEMRMEEQGQEIRRDWKKFSHGRP